MITFLSSLACFVPTVFLAQLFPSWPITQLLVLQNFICSPNAVFASLRMANDEMNTIRELDIDLIRRKNHRLWMYFAEQDDWVGNQREHILRAFSGDGEHVQIVHGAPGIPHAFCISENNLLLVHPMITIYQITVSNSRRNVSIGCAIFMFYLRVCELLIFLHRIRGFAELAGDMHSIP
jgi:hypothetical protein